jgi:hypothetical protein
VSEGGKIQGKTVNAGINLTHTLSLSHIAQPTHVHALHGAAPAPPEDTERPLCSQTTHPRVHTAQARVVCGRDISRAPRQKREEKPSFLPSFSMMIGNRWSDMDAGACVAVAASAAAAPKRRSQRRSIFEVEGKKFGQILKSLSVSPALHTHTHTTAISKSKLMHALRTAQRR